MSTGARWVLVWLGLAATTGCPNASDQSAIDGADKLKQCDVRGAAAAFSAAQDSGSTRPEVALAFALTSIATLADAPELAPILPRLGFTGPLDSAVVWGPGGLLERLARHDSCSSVESYLRTTIPHPSLRIGGPEFRNVLDPTLTFGEARDVALSLASRFDRIASALQTAAAGTSPAGTELSGGCGVPQVTIRPAEMFAAAAVFSGLSAVLRASTAYDGAIPGRYLFDASDSSYATTLNDHLLHLVSAEQLGPLRGALQNITLLLLQAIDAALNAPILPNSRVAFDWARIPAPILADLRIMVTSAQSALTSSTPSVVPFLSPEVRIDIDSAFTRPIDWSVFNPRPFSYTNSSLQFDTGAIVADLNSRFTPAVFSVEGQPPPMSISTSLGDRWKTFTSDDWAATFDPQGLRTSISCSGN